MGGGVCASVCCGCPWVCVQGIDSSGVCVCGVGGWGWGGVVGLLQWQLRAIFGFGSRVPRAVCMASSVGRWHAPAQPPGPLSLFKQQQNQVTPCLSRRFGSCRCCLACLHSHSHVTVRLLRRCVQAPSPRFLCWQTRLPSYTQGTPNCVARWGGLCAQVGCHALQCRAVFCSHTLGRGCQDAALFFPGVHLIARDWRLR